MLFPQKIVTFYVRKFYLFNSSDGCHDTNAEAKENPCIVVQVVWWNNGVLDAVESKTWLAWPTGAQAFVWVGGCWKSQKERNGTPLIDCINISFCFVLCYGEEVPTLKWRKVRLMEQWIICINEEWSIIYWFRHIMNFLLVYLQLQLFCKYIFFNASKFVVVYFLEGAFS